MVNATDAEAEVTEQTRISVMHRHTGRRAAAFWLLGLSLVAVTALHVILTILHWPFPSPIARYAIPHDSRPQLLATLSVLVLFQSLVLPFLARLERRSASLLRGLPSIVLWLSAATALYVLRWAPLLGYSILIPTLLIAPLNVLLLYLRRKRFCPSGAAEGEVGGYETLPLSEGKAMVLFLLAFNLALLAMPYILFITSPPPLATHALTKASFHFGYMDVSVGERNPIFHLGRTVIGLFGRTYLTNHLLTLSLNVLAAVLFGVAVSRLWGIGLAVMTCAVIITDRWFMKVAYIGNNAGTLLLPCAISVMCLMSIASEQAPRQATPLRRGLRTGVFMGLLLCLVPYVYAAARPVIALVGLLAVGWAAFRVWQSTRMELLGFAFLLVLPSLLPSALLIWSYDWSIARAVGDFKATAYNPPALKLDARPESLGVEETGSPDLPIWLGFKAGFSRASGGSGERESVYWNRSPIELAQAVGIHLRNAWRLSAGSFPGAPYAEILFLAGLYLLAQAQIGPARGFWLVSYMCVALVSPYLLVASPNEFRRGAAVLLPFSLGIAVAILITAKWVLGVWIRDQRRLAAASVLAGVMGVMLLRYPMELTQLSHEGLDIGIQLDCASFPIRELLLSPTVQQIRGAELLFERQGDAHCIDAALATIEVRRQLRNPGVIAVASREELARAIDGLQSYQYLVLDCGASARRYGKQDELCASNVVRQHTAFVVPASPHDFGAVWTVVK